MFKTCPYCHKIVPAGHRCEVEQKIRKDRRNQLSRHYNHSSEYKQFIHSSEWTDMRNRVIDRDNGLDQAALHGLDPDHPMPYIMADHLEVHHIIKADDDPSRRMDMTNLITLSSHTHALAEQGKIDKDTLLRLAENNTTMMVTR